MLILLTEGICMDAKALWQMFMDTGAPEFYLMYNQVRKAEVTDVFNDPGAGAQSNQI